MSNQKLAKAASAAKKAVSNVANRHAGNCGGGRSLASVADPDESRGSDSEEEGEDLQLWRLLPQLKELPESLLRKLPMDAMFQLNSALAKEKKSSEKLGVNTRLAHNAKRVARHPTTVEKGLDNRRDQLHPARFLGGVNSALAEQWSAARSAIGDAGIVALGNYDLDAIGCGGCVSPKAWLEIHNPASQELKLKLFHLPNVAASGLSTKRLNSDGGEEGESLKEIADMEGFRVALNTAREAMASALPWNRSISAVVGLMMNTNYLQDDVGGNPKRAAILTEFTDYIFSRNALNWENSQPFLTTDDLTHVWSNWRCKRGISQKSSEPKKKEKDQKKEGNNVCRLYNTKVCKSQTEKECKSSWGKQLKHLCNKFIGGGKMCLKEHPRIEHV